MLWRDSILSCSSQIKKRQKGRMPSKIILLGIIMKKLFIKVMLVVCVAVSYVISIRHEFG